jgi:hypothetical protein
LPVLKKKRNKIILNFFIVFFIFNMAYFFRVIPPVPLSIKKWKSQVLLKKVMVGI